MEIIRGPPLLAQLFFMFFLAYSPISIKKYANYKNNERVIKY